MKIFGADLDGIEGRLIEFQATMQEERRGAILLGLAQKVVKEGYSRAVQAIQTLREKWGESLELRGYTIQLSPAETPKRSSGLDLPIAITLLQATILQSLDSLRDEIIRLEEETKKRRRSGNEDEIRQKLIKETKRRVEIRERIAKYQDRLKRNDNKYLLIGELNIVDGHLRKPDYGMFGMINAAKPGFTVIVPEDSEIHAGVIAKCRNKEIKVVIAKDLQEVWNVMLGLQVARKPRYLKVKIEKKQDNRYRPDFKAIEEVSIAKRAMIVALAGGHNILLVGPPGHGKTMLAKAAAKVLPDLSTKEMMEVNKIYSAKGILQENELVIYRPYQEAVNFTEQALFGGGKTHVMPGLVSLAHQGILLIDEINLKAPNLIEQLRVVLNDREHRVQRVQQTITFPCSFILVAAMNPCKCGWYGHYICPKCGNIYFGASAKCPQHPNAILNNHCTCKKIEIEHYRDKISEPLMDRIDLKVFVSTHTNEKRKWDYSSKTIKTMIRKAHHLQNERFRNKTFGNRNAHVPDRSQMKCLPRIPEEVENWIGSNIRRLTHTKRMQVKLILVSQTIADLNESPQIRIKHVKEAIELMGLRNPYFAERGRLTK